MISKSAGLSRRLDDLYESKDCSPDSQGVGAKTAKITPVLPESWFFKPLRNNIDVPGHQ